MLKLFFARVCFLQSQTVQHWFGVAFVDTEPRRLRLYSYPKQKMTRSEGLCMNLLAHELRTLARSGPDGVAKWA